MGWAVEVDDVEVVVVVVPVVVVVVVVEMIVEKTERELHSAS